MDGQGERNEWVVWLLEFTQTDLDMISAGDRAKLAVEISQLAGTHFGSETPILIDGSQGIKYSQQFLIRDGTGKMIDIQNFDLRPAQTCLQQFLFPLLDRIEQLQTIIKGGWTEAELQPAPVLQSFEISNSLNLCVNFPFVERVSKQNTDGTVTTRYRYPPLSEVPIADTFQTDSMEDALRYRVTQILKGVMMSVFHRCPECQRWFAHFSERKRAFCSNRCATRYGVRESRKELKSKYPEKYEESLRAGAERAHKSYTSKIKNGKPARRPYKYKQEGESHGTTD
ncbi:MAG: hypothetical protein ACLQVJ_14415 [Syntrophobacteraceae bacterium]